MSTPALSPLADYLLVQWVPSAPASDSLIVPATEDRTVRWADVLKAGPLVRDVRPGDRVLASTLASFEVAEEYAIIKAATIQLLALEDV